MEDNLFTASQSVEKETGLSPSIQSAISGIREYFFDQEIKVVTWNENYIAIPIVLKINLPTRGTVNEVDIRENEPIFILLERKQYPYKAPLALSDRKDFPKDCLPHLNPKPIGNPANFCLHRGSIDTWFSEHTIIDFIERIRDWLSDAASDMLMRKEDGFEATRIDSSLGYCIYEPSAIQAKIIDEWQRHRNMGGFCFLFYRLINNPKKEPLVGDGSSYVVKLESSIDSNNIAKSLDLSKQINSYFTEENKMDRYLFGILIWPPKNQVYKPFLGSLPNNLDQLIQLSQVIKLPLERALNSYFSKNLQLFNGIPITFVIPRPRNILNSNSKLELLNFVVSHKNNTSSLKDAETLNSGVWPMWQRSPLTINRAREMSLIPLGIDVGKILFLGCGAIGSKLGLHLSKCGLCDKVTFADYDDLSPHNLIRHGLLSESLGMNKAEAMKENLIKLYSFEKDKIKADAIKNNCLNIFLGNKHELLCQHSWLIDASASTVVREVIIQENIPSSLKICRCEIADDGKLGFMSVEGPKRNPRLDDILYFLFDLAIDHPEISNWLCSTKQIRESNIGTVLEEISIGISCNTETMRLADDNVSFHTSLFSVGFRKIALSNFHNHNQGLLQISYNNMDQESNCVVESFKIDPFEIIFAENVTNWEIRIKNGIKEQLIQKLHDSQPNETGGLLVGQVDSKKRVIYITRFLSAPPDSESSPYSFKRGILDVPEEISNIVQLSGDTINYVGEWHIHPTGGKQLSSIDMDAISQIQKVLDPVSRPTFVMIVTKKELYAYVFPLSSS